MMESGSGRLNTTISRCEKP